MEKALVFSGASDGPTLGQLRFVEDILPLIAPAFDVVLHGDCIGFDAAAHRMVRNLTQLPIEGYSVPGPKCAECDCDLVNVRTGHLARNREMVDRAQLLIAAPPADEPQRRGGTWYTIKYALKTRVPVLQVLRNGQAKMLGPPKPCIHGRPDYGMCPWCNGINNRI